MAFAAWQFAYDNDMKSKTMAATNNCSRKGDLSPDNDDAHTISASNFRNSEQNGFKI